MGGITITIESDLSDLLQRLEEAEGALREELEDALGERAILYDQDLRGAGPGLGLTPFDTGRLLMGGTVVQDGIQLEFTNQTEYAEWARPSGAPIGEYAEASGRAFRQRFEDELIPIWEEITERAMEGDL